MGKLSKSLGPGVLGRGAGAKRDWIDICSDVLTDGWTGGWTEGRKFPFCSSGPLPKRKFLRINMFIGKYVTSQQLIFNIVNLF